MSKRLSRGSLLFVLILTVILCAVAPYRSEAAKAKAKAKAKLVEFTINNNTRKTVSIAFAREGYNGDESTRGWWVLEPYESRTIRPFNFNSDDYYFWYAKAGKIVWRGEAFDGWIHQKEAFKSERGRRVPEGDIVGFRRLKVSKSGKATLNLTIKE